MAVHARFRPVFLPVVSLLLLAVFGLGAVGCASQPTVPQPQQMPQGQDFSGVWYSQQFEHMHLRQMGDQVSGVYTYKEGGRIEGTVDGNLLVFDWIEPGDKSKAQRTMKGRGYLQLVTEGDEAALEGEWGYNDQVTGAGPWSAEWVRELNPEDPLTLQDLRED